MLITVSPLGAVPVMTSLKLCETKSSFAFAKPDTDTFVLLKTAFDVIGKGGALPAVLNASNEEVVAAFLNNKIKFYQIPEIVCATVEKFDFSSDVHELDEILKIAKESRAVANDLIFKNN